MSCFSVFLQPLGLPQNRFGTASDRFKTASAAMSPSVWESLSAKRIKKEEVQPSVQSSPAFSPLSMSTVASSTQSWAAPSPAASPSSAEAGNTAIAAEAGNTEKDSKSGAMRKGKGKTIGTATADTKAAADHNAEAKPEQVKRKLTGKTSPIPPTADANGGQQNTDEPASKKKRVKKV